MSAYRLVALAALLAGAPARAADADTLIDAHQRGWSDPRMVRLIVRETWYIEEQDWARLSAAGLEEDLLASLRARLLAQADRIPDEPGPRFDPVPHTPLPAALAVSAAVVTAVGLSVALTQLRR